MDDVDKAMELELQQRQRAIEQVVRRVPETPLLNDDYQRICRDCGDVIHLMRLMVVPHAVRCMPCQEEHEAGTR